MHKRRNLKGRQSIKRRASLLSCILQLIATPSFVISLLTLPALTVSGCSETGIRIDGDGNERHEPNCESGQEAVDSVLFSIAVGVDDRVTGNDGQIRTLDIFIYDCDGLQELERHMRLKREDGITGPLTVNAPPGTKNVVGIANLPYEVDEVKVKRYDAIELLTARFRDDDTHFPIMSGTCQLSAESGGSLILKPLMSAVVVSSITNSMSGYRRLEDPELILVSPSCEAEILRESGFRPNSQERDSSRLRLDCDIGTFTQYPAARLLCYPNDEAEAEPAAGTPPTLCILCCTIDSTEVQYCMEMPRLKRNGSVELSLEVTGADTFSYSCQ